MVRSRQMIGVRIWQQLVQGCRFCRCKFLIKSARIWCALRGESAMVKAIELYIKAASEDHPSYSYDMIFLFYLACLFSHKANKDIRIHEHFQKIASPRAQPNLQAQEDQTNEK